MKPLFAVSVAVVLSSLVGAAAPPRATTGQARSFEGVVKAIKGRVAVLDGDRTFSTGGQTQYLLESGRDPQEVTRAALKSWQVAGTVKEVKDGKIVVEDILGRSDQAIPVGKDTRYFTREMGKAATDLAFVKKGAWVVADLRGKDREKAVAASVVVVPPGPAK